MDASLLWTVIGTIVTIVGTYLGYLSWRGQPKTKIFFFAKQHLKLYDDLVSKIDDLEIIYRGQPIRSNMFVLKGAFICLGPNDIDASNAAKALILTINGEDAKWHTYETVVKKDNLDLDLSTNGKELVINFRLFKNRDYFVLEALAQSDSLSFTINNRISNVPNVITATVGIEKKIKNTLQEFALAWIIGFGLFIPVLYFVIPARIEPTYFKNNAIVSVNSSASLRDTLFRVSVLSNHVSDSIKARAKLEDSINPLIVRPWVYEDSLRSLTVKEHSWFHLFFSGNNQIYESTPHYTVRFKLTWHWYDLFLIAWLGMCILFFAVFVESLRDYYRYKDAAALAGQILT
jgi:hypothetical protein